MNLLRIECSLGSIRLTQSLIDAPNATYWLSIRLTRYRAHPPHSFVHLHATIHEDNFYLPSCLHVYQHVKFYDSSVQSSLARVQGVSSYPHLDLQYSLVNEIFSIDQYSGFIQLRSTVSSPQQQQLPSDYRLTIRVFDVRHHLSVNCYLSVHLLQRNQLTPTFLSPSTFNLDLLEISPGSERLRQRLFQVAALLEHRIDDRALEVRYRIVDLDDYFIVNAQTGYVAAKQALYAHSVYEFNVGRRAGTRTECTVAFA